jgi:hypothetical protein
MGQIVSNGKKYSGGGSSTQWNQVQNTGVKIAEIIIDGVQTNVFAPSGSGGNGKRLCGAFMQKPYNIGVIGKSGTPTFYT